MLSTIKSSKRALILLVFLLIGAVFLFAGCGGKSSPAGEEGNAAPGEQEGGEAPAGEESKQGEDDESGVEVTLYFSDNEAMYLLPELRSIKPGSSVAEAVVQELMAGPLSKDCLATLPAGLELISLEIEDGIAYVNFNEALYSVQGSAGEIMAVYSVVNSLAELPEIEKVSFLIEGSEVDSLVHMALDEALEPRWDLVRDSSD
ncbi:MAG: GerMN domain-containing protein [Firmicutes bacterium]|nr:GerMN domain-containing protein [Bacillota bacterium]